MQRVIRDSAVRRGPEHMLRLWSAGCASGEEAYSLAMVMAEEGAPSFILATDVSRAALRSAQAATYGRWSMRGLDDARLARWFQAAGERWRLADAIRKRVGE